MNINFFFILGGSALVFYQISNSSKIRKIKKIVDEALANKSNIEKLKNASIKEINTLYNYVVNGENSLKEAANKIFKKYNWQQW